jgi:hypothetical protein
LPSLGLLVFLVALIWLKTPGRGRLSLDSNNKKRRELLAGMAVEAIRRPSAWTEIPGLWHRPFIPCLGGRVISLARLLRLATRERLFIGRRENPLARAAVRSGCLVLDRDDEEFLPLFERLTNLRDLEELFELKPAELPSGPEAELLSSVNSLMKTSRAGVRLHAVRPQGEKIFIDVDLSPIRAGKARKCGMPRRFVAVNTQSDWWRRLSELHTQHPALAACLAADKLCRDSGLVRFKAQAVRRTAANRVVASGVGA